MSLTQNKTMAIFNTWNSRRWAFLAGILFVASVAASSGCQSLGSRFRSEVVDPEAEDDWAPPVVRSRNSSGPGSGQPVGFSPNIPRSASNQNVAPNAAGATVASTPTTAKDNSPKVDSTVKASLASPSIDAKSTGADGLDIDGTIAAMPPGFQELAKRQLLAMQAREGKSSENQSPAEPESSKLTTQTVSVNRKFSDEGDPSSNAILATSEKPVIDKETTATKASFSDAEALEASTAEIAFDPEPTKSAIDSEVVQASANIPIQATSSASTSWNATLSESIRKLESEINASVAVDENLRLNQEMTLRMLYVANRQLDDAVRPIEGLDTNEQDYFRHQLQAMFEAANPDAMPIRSRRWSLVMRSQRQATDKLAAASNLEVKSLAFCNDVQGYGVMTKFPKYVFNPDQEVLLYCELENVMASELKNGFETQLQGTYEILDSNGRRIANQLLPMEKEICQNRRRDYFIIYHIYLPSRIEAGKYQMRVTVEDMKAKKFGQADLDFEINNP